MILKVGEEVFSERLSVSNLPFSGPRHTMVSTFYNDLFAFDMERRRWYKLGIKQKKEPMSKQAKSEARKLKLANQAGLKVSHENGDKDEDEDDDSDEGEDDDVEESIIISKDGQRLTGVKVNEKDLFGYIDETGNVIYINIEDEFGLEENLDNLNIENSDQPESNTSAVPLNSTQTSVTLVDISPEIVDGPKQIVEQPVKTIESPEELDGEEDPVPENSALPLPTTELEKSTYFGRYFEDQRQPCSRINPCLMIR
jgi:hypothetical protein